MKLAQGHGILLDSTPKVDGWLSQENSCHAHLKSLQKVKLFPMHYNKVRIVWVVFDWIVTVTLALEIGSNILCPGR